MNWRENQQQPKNQIPIVNRFRVYRNGRGSHEKIMDNLNKIKKISKDYLYSKVRFIVTLTYYSDVNKIEHFFNNFPYKISHNKLRTNFARTNESINNYKKDIVKKYQSNFLELENKFIKNLTKNRNNCSIFSLAFYERHLLPLYKRQIFSGFSSTHYPNGICIPGIRKVFVDIKGNFYICEKTDNFQTIGNVNQGFDYAKINKIINDYIKLSEKKCSKCWAVRLCRVCFVSAIHGKYLSINKKNIACENFKRKLLYSLMVYTKILEKKKNALDYMQNIWVG